MPAAQAAGCRRCSKSGSTAAQPLLARVPQATSMLWAILIRLVPFRSMMTHRWRTHTSLLKRPCPPSDCRLDHQHTTEIPYSARKCPWSGAEAHTLTCYWQSMLHSLERGIVCANDRQLQAVQTRSVDWPCLEVGSGFLTGNLGCLGLGGPDPAGAWASHRSWAQSGACGAAQQPACSRTSTADITVLSGTALHLKIAPLLRMC